MTRVRVLVVVAVAACGGKDPPVTSAPAAAPAAAPVAAAPAAFPPLETSCATDEDCTTTGRWSNCCGVCEQKYASKAYVAKTDAFCTANPPEQCPPMGCSWGMSAVGCVDGVCREKLPKRSEPKIRQPLPPPKT